MQRAERLKRGVRGAEGGVDIPARWAGNPGNSRRCGSACRWETSITSTVSTGECVYQAGAEWAMEGSEAFPKNHGNPNTPSGCHHGGAHGLVPLRQPAPHCHRFPTAASCCLLVRCLFWLSHLRGCRLPTLDSHDGNRQPAGDGVCCRWETSITSTVSTGVSVRWLCANGGWNDATASWSACGKPWRDAALAGRTAR